MLEIVTRARVSKRDLYALFNNKHAVLAAGIKRTRATDAPALGPGDSCAADPGCASGVRFICRVSLCFRRLLIL